MNLTLRSTQKRQVLPIGTQVEAVLPKQDGLVVISAIHSTVAITTANLDPGTGLDLLDALDRLIAARDWRHPHDPTHAPDHLLASIIGPSIALPVYGGNLVTGVWQHLVMIELDGPSERRLAVTFIPG